jgi:hypothetical protein
MAVKKKPSPRKVGRKCTICIHNQVGQINSLVAEGVSFGDIAGRYDLKTSSIHRHTVNCLKQEIQALVQQKKIEQAFNFEAELQTLYKKALEMHSAIDAWLRDPENTNQINITPRDSELVIVYDDYTRMFMGRPTRAKARLSDLLELLSTVAQKEAIAIQSTAVDNRKLYLDAFKTLNDRLEQMAKFYGVYQNPRDNVNNASTIADGFQRWIVECQRLHTQFNVPMPTAEEIAQQATRYAEGNKVDPKQLIDKIEQISKAVN